MKHYSVEIDTVTEAEWSHLLTEFDDANIYQTWQYGKRRWGESCLSHLVVQYTGIPVVLAQLAIKRLWGLGYGIGYIAWGPLWRRKRCANIEHLRFGINVLKDEYSKNQRLLLRIVPNEVDSLELTNFLSDIGFTFVRKRYRTFRLDLKPSLEQLRKGLNQKWRNHLNCAQRNGLSLEEGVGDELYEKFTKIYKQMMKRKQFYSSVDIDDFRIIQKDLPDELKMKIFICSQNGEPVAALVGSAIGDTGIYLLGATNELGMKNKGSYLLQWRMIQWLKERGCSFYDLGGINPQINPGVYQFKSGLGGTDIWYIGEFEFCQNKVSSRLVHFANQIKSVISNLKCEFRDLRQQARHGDTEKSPRMKRAGK